jgi:hypothetical protein
VGDGFAGFGGGGGGAPPGDGAARTPVAMNAIMAKYLVKCMFCWVWGLRFVFV